MGFIFQVKSCIADSYLNCIIFFQAPPEGPTGGLCPKGGYCPQGAKTPEPCPVGKYSGTQGNKEPDDCVTCDPGYGIQCSLLSLLWHSQECVYTQECISFNFQHLKVCQKYSAMYHTLLSVFGNQMKHSRV